MTTKPETRMTTHELAAIRRTLSGDTIAITAREGRLLLAEYDRLRAAELEAGTAIAEAGDCYATDCPFCGVDCAADEESAPVHSEDCPCAYDDMAMWVRCLVSLHGCESHVATIAREAADLPADASPKAIRDALEALRLAARGGPAVAPPSEGRDA